MRRVATPLVIDPAAARPPDGRSLGLDGLTMGVAWTLRAVAPATISDPQIADAVQAACDVVVAEMSTWEADSDLSRFNRAAAGEWVDIPFHMATVVQAALEAAAFTGGAFDPTVGPLVDLWGFGPAGAATRPPAAEDLAAATVGWRRLQWDDGARRLRQPGGLHLDLSGIAKGYAVDLAAAALEALGVRHFLLEIGGELRGSGVKSGGEPWWVEIEPPPGASLAEAPILVALHGLSIATSGDWRRSLVADGRRYSHSIDPVTRTPCQGNIASVTVLDPRCMRADALCTALMVMGDAAIGFAERHDLMAHVVTRGPTGFTETVSAALRRLLD